MLTRMFAREISMNVTLQEMGVNVGEKIKKCQFKRCYAMSPVFSAVHTLLMRCLKSREILMFISVDTSKVVMSQSSEVLIMLADDQNRVSTRS